MQNRNTFFKQFFQLGIGTIINLVIGVLTTPIITRLVDPTEYGQLSLFNTYSSIAIMIFTIGLDQTFVRYYYTQETELYKQKLLKVCFGIPIVFASIGAIIIYVCHRINPQLLGFNNIIILLFIANIYILIVNRFGMLVVRLQYKTAIYSLMNILHKALYVALVIPFVLLLDNHYLYILIGATLVSVLIPSIICIIFEKPHWLKWDNIKSESVNIVELIRYGFPLMIASGVFILLQATDKLSIKYFGTYSDVGVYSSAQSLMSVFSIVQTTFNTLWTPKAIEHYEQNKEDRVFYSQMNKIITILMFTFGACILLFKDLFILFLGEKYRAATEIIPFLMFNPIMYTISETTVVGLSITKHTNCQMVITAVSCLVNFIGNILLIPIMRSKGAAVSTGISYILFFTLRTLFSNHYFKVNYQLGRFYLLTAVFAGSCFYSMYNSFNVGTIVVFIGTIMLLCALYKDTVVYIIKMLLQMIKN